MKSSTRRAKTSEPVADVYRAFMSLDRGHRRTAALRILRNQGLLAELYDHFLIERALREGGQSISVQSCRRSPIRIRWAETRSCGKRSQRGNIEFGST